MSGGGIFELDTLSASQGAPTKPGLPNSAGGDQELRFYEGDTSAPGTSFITTPLSEIYDNATISAHVGFSLINGYGGRSIGVMAGIKGYGSSLSGYVANISHNFTNDDFITAGFHLSTMIGGVISVGSVFASSSPFIISPENENYLIELALAGDLITASLWRVIPGQENSLISILTANDSAYSSGSVGLRAFATGDTSVYFDDVTVSAVPVPAAVWLFSSGLLGLIGVARRKKS